MKWAVLPFALLAGCAHTHSDVNIGAGTPHSGVSVHVEGGRGLAALLGLSILAAGIHEMERDNVRYLVNPFVTISGNSPPPELAPDRKIAEHDCTRPLEELSGNLRCR